MNTAGAVMHSCLARIENLTLSRGMSKWLELVVTGDKQTQQSLLANFKSMMEQMSSLRSKMGVQAEKECARTMRNVLNRLTRLALYYGWNKWFDLCRAKRRSGLVMQRAMNRIAEGPTLSAWSKWVNAIDDHKWAATTIDYCFRRVTNIRLASGVRKWQNVIISIKQIECQHRISLLQNKHSRNVMADILKRWITQKQSRAFHRWSQVHDAMARSGRLVQRTFNRWIKGSLMWGWLRWCELLDGQDERALMMQNSGRKLQRVMNNWLAGSVLWGWVRWREGVDADKEARKTIKLMQAVVARIAARGLSLAFRRWLEVNRSIGCSARLIHRTFSRWTEGSVLWGWLQWRDILERQDEVATARAAAMSRSCRLAKRVMNRWIDDAVLSGWLRWCEMMDLDRACKKAIKDMNYWAKRILNAVVARSFNKWTELVSRLQHKQSDLENHYLLAENHNANTKILALKQATVRSYIKRWINNKLAQAWVAWKSVNEKMEVAARVMRHFLGKWVDGTINGAWVKWQNLVVDKHLGQVDRKTSTNSLKPTLVGSSCV
jgi:hypothetical protein